MNVIINGKPHEISSINLEQLVSELGLQKQLVVAEVEGTIVHREDWRVTELKEKMEIEFVHFVGGG